MTKEIILNEIVEKDLPQVKKVISKSSVNNKNFYQTSVDLLSNGTRNSLEQINYLEVYEKALGVFRNASYSLRQEMDTQSLHERLGTLETKVYETDVPSEPSVLAGPATTLNTAIKPVHDEKKQDKTKRNALREQITESVGFSNKYALYFAGQVGLSLLESNATQTDQKLFLGTNYQAMENTDKLTSLLAETATKDLGRIIDTKQKQGLEINDEELKYVLENIFTSWVNQFNWATFKDVSKNNNIEDLVLKYDNFSVASGEFSRKYDVVAVEGRFMNSKRSDLIGNEEPYEKIWQYLLRLSCWDNERQHNPLAPPTALLIAGDPGCGKTISVHAAVNEFSDLCKKSKIPLLAIQHSIADYGSKYQNDTPIKLTARRDKLRDFPGIGILQASDIHTFFPASDSKESSQEEDKAKGVYYSMLDDSVIPKGKFLALLDANYVDDIAAPMMSRIGDTIHLQRFTKPEDFARYAKFYMTKDSSPTNISDHDWAEFGEYLLGTNLSNREIANVLRNLKGNFVVTTDLITQPYEKKVEFRNNYLLGIDKERLIANTAEFISTIQDVERMSLVAREMSRLERYKLDLTTEPRRTDSPSKAGGQ